MAWSVLQRLAERAPIPICVMNEQHEHIAVANAACRTRRLSLSPSRCGELLRDSAVRQALDRGRICWLVESESRAERAAKDSQKSGWLAWRPSWPGQYVALIGCTLTQPSPRAELARLEATVRAKDELLTELVHELRGPLAPIEMAIELLRSPRSEMHERALTALQRQTQHMKRLVHDLSELSHGAPNELSLKLERVELAVIIERAVDLALPLVHARQHQVLLEVPRGHLIEADPVRLVQVFSNLITNASKYTQSAGTIRVTAQVSDGDVRVRVADNGIGISEEMLPRIFELFVRSPSVQQKEGLGVGLYLVRALVEKHGGTVAARSDGPGCGSEFMVSLPLAQPRESARRRTDEPASLRSAERQRPHRGERPAPDAPDIDTSPSRRSVAVSSSAQ